jgi:hypothetical protein
MSSRWDWALMIWLLTALALGASVVVGMVVSSVWGL